MDGAVNVPSVDVQNGGALDRSEYRFWFRNLYGGNIEWSEMVSGQTVPWYSNDAGQAWRRHFFQ